MVRNDKEVFFTEEDKKNLVIREYTAEEIQYNKREYVHKRNKRRIFFLVILLIAITVALTVEESLYITSLVAIATLFISLLYEYIDRVNIKIVSQQYYVEICIECKLPVEIHLVQRFSNNSEVLRFYPVKGHDTISKFKGIFYISEKQYKKLQVGDLARIRVKGKYL